MKMQHARSLVAILFPLFLGACVQLSEFRAFQGEVRRDLTAQSRQLRELNQQTADLQTRIQSWEADQQRARRQLADLLNSFTMQQEEVAGLRGAVETFTQGGAGGLEGMRKSQSEILQELASLRQRLDQLGGQKGLPPTAAVAPPPPQPQEKPEDLYKEARFRFEEGNYPQAREGFLKLLNRFPDAELADNAQFWIGESYFREGNFKQAILEYEKMIAKHPKSGKIPSALLKQGMAFEKLGDPESARFLYRQITKDHAQSDQAPMAEFRLKNIP